ncbi:MAG: T9SS type A sorting domain-containing protein [Bacteroidales bacterium]|nr:T9SS type A sorting domain-containing protein [Bacteroidales bacterium]
MISSYYYFLKSISIVCISFFYSLEFFCQDYPVYNDEKQITVNELTFDAMEPFITPDGNYLFFNCSNESVIVKLFYASRVNDSTFNFEGELNGPNQEAAQCLDAVADIDSLNNFYWTSTRDYPGEFENLFHGTFTEGSVSNIGRVRGGFYIYIPGWLIMDHGISCNGEFLYFNNARLDAASCTGPCETHIGIAQKQNDSTFNVLANSDEILQNVNDDDYIYYAPCISGDNLELYFTRYLKGEITESTIVEMCVAVRNNSTEVFSEPNVLFADVIANIAEAATLTSDKQIMYYHKKIDDEYKIMMRYRESATGYVQNIYDTSPVKVIPNPVIESAVIRIDQHAESISSMKLIDSVGRVVFEFDNPERNTIVFQKNNLQAGIYYIKINTREESFTEEVVIQ